MANGHESVVISGDHPHRPRSPAAMSTGTLIREIGEALYGARWGTELAVELGVNKRSIRRWLAGECEPLPTVWVDLEQMLASRQVEQERLRRLIRDQRGEAFET